MKTIPEILAAEAKNSPDIVRPLMPVIIKALLTRGWVHIEGSTYKLAATILGERLELSFTNEPVLNYR